MDWISVEDRLPRVGLNVLVFGGVIFVGYHHIFLGWVSCVNYDDSGKGDVTHWMPFPDPPNEKPIRLGQ